MTKIIALHQPDPELHSCPKCRELAFQAERRLSLHVQTQNQLAQTESKLVAAKRKIRELEARLAKEGTCN